VDNLTEEKSREKHAHETPEPLHFKNERVLYERSFFDKVSIEFDEEKMTKWLSDRLRWELWQDVFKELGSLKGQLVLDIGCGLGFDSICLAFRGAGVVGLDVSPKSVKKAKELATRKQIQCDFIVGSAESLPFADRSFDKSFGRAILHHVDIDACLFEVGRVTRDKCIFVEPLVLNPIVNVNRRLLDKYDRTPYEKPLLLSKTLESFKKRFKIVHHKEHHLISPAAHIFKKLIKSQLIYTYTWNTLNKFDKVLTKRILCLKDWCWITVIAARNPKRNINFYRSGQSRS